jgi:hypothetical protein
MPSFADTVAVTAILRPGAPQLHRWGEFVVARTLEFPYAVFAFDFVTG